VRTLLNIIWFVFGEVVRTGSLPPDHRPQHAL